MKENIDFYRTVARIFSNSVFRTVADNGQCDYLITSLQKYKSLLIDQADEPVYRTLQRAYQYLGTNYRNEYFYKNTIANKLLLGKHSLNTTTLLSEFRVAGSIADLVMLNGTSTVYEIKTELDSPEKLRKQILDYQKAFVRVNLVTHHSLASKYEKLIRDTPVGLLCIGSRHQLTECKAADSHFTNLNIEVMLRSLRKKEYSAIIAAICGEVPAVPNTQYFRACLEAARTMGADRIHELMVQELKKRSVVHKSFFNKQQLPAELVHICLCLNPTRKSFENLIHFLNNPVHSCTSPIYAANNSNYLHCAS